LPSLENLHRHFNDRPFKLFAIDVGEEKETVRDFFKNKEMSFNNLLDIDGKVSRSYGVRSHPMKFLISADGELIGVAGGYREWDSEEMKMLIQYLINNG
jgi:peroxiredoxin